MSRHRINLFYCQAPGWVHDLTVPGSSLFYLPVVHHSLCRCQKLPELLIKVLDDKGLVFEPLVGFLHLGGVGVHLVA